MSEYVYFGQTSQTIDIFLQDSSSTTGAGLSGLVFNSAGLVASYRKGATGSRTAITLATQTVGGAYSSGGFVEIDATNMKGIYRLDLPNAMVDTEGFATLYIFGATNLLATALRIDCRPLPADSKRWNALTTVALPLIPTVAGRTLDVSATGEAGIDWANIGSPTTAVNLSATNIDVDQVVASVSGAVSGSVGSVAGNVVGSVGSIASGGIAAASFAPGAIDAAAIATNAIGADEISAAAVSKIQTGLATPTNITAATGITVATIGANVITASALATDAVAEIADGVWDELLTGATHNITSSAGKRLRQINALQQVDGTVNDAGATATSFVTDLASTVDNFYNDSMLVFNSGALTGQVRAITDYVGATKTITLEEALTSAPANGVEFSIISMHIHPVSQIQSGLATQTSVDAMAIIANKIGSVVFGTVTGAGTATEVFVGAGITTTVTVDVDGNRSAVVFS